MFTMSSISERPRGRRRCLLLATAFVSAFLAAGVGATVLESNANPASAATVSFSQCNDQGAGPGGAPLSVTCSIEIVNTIDANGGTSAVVYERVCTLNGCTGDTSSSSDVINAVHQCNGSNNVGGSTTICSVDIVNNISGNAPAAPTDLNLDQCNGSGEGGGTNMTACIPSSEASPTVTQCNGSGNGGGGMMTCTASGTTSAAFPVTVDQCNGSENGGGSFVTCTTSMTTNVVDTASGTPGDTPGTPGTPGDTPGTPGDTPGTPGGPTTPATPGGPTTPGTPGGPTTPGTPGGPDSPGVPPAVLAPPNFTG